jgi:ribosomal protein L40E
MDELYEEWLLTTCDLDREEAARVRARYPRIDDLADATPEAIAESCGLSLEEAALVRAKASESLSIGDSWYSKKSEFFICPSCGAFASAGSKTCPQCGTEFEEEEEAAPAPAAEPAKEVSEQPELYICSNCGAFLSKDAESCPTCHQVIEGAEAVEEELPREVVTQVEKEEVKVCPHCGAFLAPGAERCGICGYSSAEEIVPGGIQAPEIKESKGVSQDFLARWQS